MWILLPYAVYGAIHIPQPTPPDLCLPCEAGNCLEKVTAESHHGGVTHGGRGTRGIILGKRSTNRIDVGDLKVAHSYSSSTTPCAVVEQQAGTGQHAGTTHLPYTKRDGKRLSRRAAHYIRSNEQVLASIAASFRYPLPPLSLAIVVRHFFCLLRMPTRQQFGRKRSRPCKTRQKRRDISRHPHHHDRNCGLVAFSSLLERPIYRRAEKANRWRQRNANGASLYGPWFPG